MGKMCKDIKAINQGVGSYQNTSMVQMCSITNTAHECVKKTGLRALASFFDPPRMSVVKKLIPT